MLTVWLVLAGTALAGDVAKGKDIYDARCSLCHGAEGKGDGPGAMSLSPPPANFASADYWKTADPKRIRAVIKDGKPGTSMVPFGAMLTDADISDLVGYIEKLAKP